MLMVALKQYSTLFIVTSVQELLLFFKGTNGDTLAGEVTLHAFDSTSLVLKQRIISSDSFLLLKAFYRRDSLGLQQKQTELWFFPPQKQHKTSECI